MVAENNEQRVLIGSGLLTWPNEERVGCRYGIVTLFEPGEFGSRYIPLQISELQGLRGSLLAVLQNREYDLGSGTVFAEYKDAVQYVGLRPDEPREEDWLNVENLYQVDWLLSGKKPVDLYFVPMPTLTAVT